MVAELAKTILEFIKLAPRFIVALGIAAGALLFASDHLLKRIGLTELVQKYRFALGLTLVLSAALLIVDTALSVLGSINGWWGKRRFHRDVIKRLHHLTEDEKQILRYYVANNTRANMLRFDDGVVQGLIEDGSIYQSASMGNILEGFAHNISDIAWGYLHVYPNLLTGETNYYRTDKRERYRV
jgi:hypothetical protein